MQPHVVEGDEVLLVSNVHEGQRQRRLAMITIRLQAVRHLVSNHPVGRDFLKSNVRLSNTDWSKLLKQGRRSSGTLFRYSWGELALIFIAAEWNLSKFTACGMS